MFKKTFIAIAALGLAGALTAAPTTPAEAFLVDCKDARYAHTERCVRKAERKARWDAFWAGLFDKRDRVVVREDRSLRLFDKRDRRAIK